MIPFPWCWVAFLAAQSAAATLTVFDKWDGGRATGVLWGLAWPAAALAGLAHGAVRGYPWEMTTTIGTLVPLAAILGTGLRPGLLFGASTKRGGKTVTHLMVRRVTGVLTLLVTLVWMFLAIIESDVG